MTALVQQAVLFLTLAVAVHADWVLTWSDEFDGNAGTPPDGAKWNFNEGGGGWGNNEKQVYTRDTKNAALDGAGNLQITAIKDGAGQFTSARLLTQDRFSQTYGKFEARIRIPYGKGIWPAFWMLGTDINTNPWPNCGEIDIMEVRGSDPITVAGTIHGPGYSGGEGITASTRNPNGRWLSEEFHVFAVEWSPDSITWYLDGTAYKTRTPADLNGKSWVFNHDFFIILNVAVGGNYDGEPGPDTIFPQVMSIDYVRVYRQG